MPDFIDLNDRKNDRLPKPGYIRLLNNAGLPVAVDSNGNETPLGGATPANVAAAIAEDPAGVRAAAGAAAVTSINIREAPYNAVGDGEADDTAAIQAALDSLGSLGGRVFIPSGSYKLSDELTISKDGTDVIGQSKLSVRLVQTNLTKGVFKFANAVYNHDYNFRRMTLIASGGSSTGTAISFYKTGGGFIQNTATCEDLLIENFEVGIHAENFPKLLAMQVQCKNCVTAYLLVKTDTFHFILCGAGAPDRTEETFAFKILKSTVAPTGPNFGGVIDGGEWGDMSHFLYSNGGTLTVREPNLERIDGNYVVKLMDQSYMTWIKGRIDNVAAVGVQSLFTLLANDPNLIPQLTVTGKINGGYSGYRQVQLCGTAYYNLSVETFGTLLTAVYSATEDGSIVTTLATSETPSRRTDSAMTGGAAYRGRSYRRIIDDAQLGSDTEVFVYRGSDGVYRRSSKVNDSYSRVIGLISTPVSNVEASEENLMDLNFAVYEIANVGWTVHLEAFGTFAANANNKRIRVLFGHTSVPATIYDTGVVTPNGTQFKITAMLIMRHATETNAGVGYLASEVTAAPPMNVATVTRGFSQANAIRIAVTGAAAGDVTLTAAKVWTLKNGSEF